ncbi:hypothetical protein [Nitrosomonas sp. Nm34]|uniref:hypothetical protein n=1 Tax=Nitrosomonas sp. Nm34 TaxID=1881055 RepID=UPI0008F22D7A|nr:hypothetical protein [Nitrosomonas sp. Nm34]SFI91043.1 putative transposase [Nitrosomonas sp. Nm34]
MSKKRILSLTKRKEMIASHGSRSQVRQCQLLNLARSTYYYQPQPIINADLVLLRMMDEQYLKTPQYGSRSLLPGFSARESC